MIFINIDILTEKFESMYLQQILRKPLLIFFYLAPFDILTVCKLKILQPIAL
jgi:hypothetical protein